jgi:DedD protein
MEVRVRERLIGALVLVALVVLLVPAILKGRAPETAAEPAAQTRRVEVPLASTAQAPDDEPALATVPELADAAPGMAPSLAEARAAAPDAAPVHAELPSEPAPREVSAAAPAPKAEKPKPKPESAPAPPPSPAATGWAVQVAAFSTRSKADQVVSELRKRRYSAFVLEYRASGKVLYRVRVGPEQDRARAEAIAARLSKDGYQPVVARHP